MSEQKKLVMLDAGHGGSDPGAMGGGMREADAVLLLVQYEAQLWRKIGVEVALTRDSDRTVPLATRTALENKLRPACFLSHHMDDAPPRKDGSPNIDACGATVWLHSRAPENYVAWAQAVLQGIAKVGLSGNRAKDIQKGHRDGANYNYAVNGNTVGPSMLLELGFISSPANRAEFARSYKAYAEAIVRGSCQFLGWDCAALDSDPPGEDTAALQKRIGELQAELAQEQAKTQCLNQKIESARQVLSA